MATAVAVNASAVAVIDKSHMVEMMHRRPVFNDQFLSHMLARNIRIEEDLVDQLFNSSEKRLARTLLLLARYGKRGARRSASSRSCRRKHWRRSSAPPRSRVSFFMNKFRKLGFIEYNGGIKVKARC